MTVPATTRRSSVFTGNGAAVAFPFTFKVFANTDIQVIVTSVAGVSSTAVLGSDYTVALNPDQAVAPGGTVNYLVAPATGVTLVIIGALPYNQTLSLPQGGNFNPSAIENALDRTEIQIQQLAASLDGAIKTPVGELAPALPAAAQRASRLLGFDSLGNPTVFAPVDGTATALAIDLSSSVTPSKGAGQIGFGAGLVYPAGTVGKWLTDLVLSMAASVTAAASSAGSAAIGWVNAGTGAVLRTVQARLRDRISPLDFGCVGDGTADDTAALALCVAAVPAYGTLDLLGKTYSITAPPARPAVGVMIRNGRIKLNNNTAQFLYGLVANDYCVFDSIYFLGTGITGGTSNLTFTASVGGASSGTLTGGITDGLYVVTFSNGNVRAVTVTGGTAATWTGALTAGVVTTATYADPTKVKYQGGIFGGNTGYPAPMNTAPASYVTVRGCTFSNLTVGVWSGGASIDAVPVGWHVVDNNFVNIVGLAGISEGYGVLFTPTTNGVIRGNSFKTIRRHAVYIAGEASNNVVDGNVIDGCDNIAIQSNTAVTQNFADGNVISNNTMRSFTRSVPYGYRSSIGIGLYGKVQNTVVVGNKIYGPLDTGVDTAGELSGSPYSDRLSICTNQIVMDPTATDAGIRLDGLQSGKVSGNSILLQSTNYGVIITSAAGTSTRLVDVTDNTVETTNAAAQGFRIALTAARVVRVFRNTLNGFALGTYANAMNDTSSAGTVRTDLNQNVGYFASDANFTHFAGGTVASTDCPNIRHAGTLTAIRSVFLDKAVLPAIGSCVTIMRFGGGAFALNVCDGVAGGTIKALSTGQWGRFGWNGTTWEEVGFGSL